MVVPGDTKHPLVWNAVDWMVDLFPMTEMTVVFGIDNRHQVAGFNRVATLQLEVPNRAPAANAGGRTRDRRRSRLQRHLKQRP
jgi:hypothetical protein